MINVSDMKRGILLDMDGAPWQVIDCAFQTPSARGASTLTKIKIKNLKTGQVLNKSYRGGEMLNEADCEKRGVQFLYKDGDEFAFFHVQVEFPQCMGFYEFGLVDLADLAHLKHVVGSWLFLQFNPRPGSCRSFRIR